MFIKQTLRKDPQVRLTIDKVLDHAWFKVAPRDSLKPDVQHEVLANLQQFKNNSVFFSLCVASVARQLDHSSLKNVHKVFADMDTNGDGVLELHEVKAGFERLFGKDSPQALQVEEMFEKLDLDGSGTIDYTEFCAAGIGEQMSTQRDLLWASFKTFDADNDGSVSKDEIIKVLREASVQKSWSKSVCDQVAKEIMCTFDSDGDGNISFDEWLEMMQGAQVKQIDGGVEPDQIKLTKTEDHLLADIERACQAGQSEEAYQLIRQLQDSRKSIRDIKANAPPGVLRGFTDRMASPCVGGPCVVM